ncbi:MAG TPA: MXAN_2562 family outer membrane beta-barrel protein [Gammaproteobacteria bacterium]|nr:MXAN_2562 family outer membrane beta-barrel protein [Gammaproteobacteria bacterium]
MHKPTILALPLSYDRGFRLAALLLCAMSALPAAAQEEGAAQTSPDVNLNHSHWSAEVRTGRFEPELEEWATYYGDTKADVLGLSLAWKFLRQVEVGLAIDYIEDKGVGTLPNGAFGGEVDFHMYPAHLYVMLRGVFFENQWVVPYAGGGLSRVYYRQEIDNQSSVRGHADGDHTRYGLQFLLDGIDPGNAAGFEEEGVENTYLFIEKLSYSAELQGVELGGDSTMFGLLFEF